MLKCLIKGIYKSQSKNLSLFEPGNFNRFFILTDLEKFRIISALPLKLPNKVFHRFPYLYLWTLRILKTLNLLETPRFIWFVLKNLEKYIQQNPKNFPYWFLYHLKRELGYAPDLEYCHSCQKKLKEIAFFDNKQFLYCNDCKKPHYLKITKKELELAKKIKSLTKVPHKIPEFLKKIMLKF